MRRHSIRRQLARQSRGMSRSIRQRMERRVPCEPQSDSDSDWGSVPGQFLCCGYQRLFGRPAVSPDVPASPQYALGNQFIKRIQFGCLAANGKRIAVGNPPIFREVGAPATRGAWAFPSASLPNDRRCPVGGIAFGMKGTVFAGLRTLQLVCDN